MDGEALVSSQDWSNLSEEEMLAEMKHLEDRDPRRKFS